MVAAFRHALIGIVLSLLAGPFAQAQDVMHAEHRGEQAHPNFDEGDVVAVIGNTFAVRMQRFPYVETLLSTRLPQHELQFRYLGRSGDEVALRPRPLNFGDLHTHLRDVEADVIVACFGLNEAFKGLGHLEQFRANLAGFVDTLRTTAYNGDRAPSVVLVSPIAHEDLDHIPADAEGHNRSLEAYLAAMAGDPDAYEKDFVPDSDRVLWATDLIGSGEEDQLSFIVPDDPGDYPYECTFPGHWRTMNGIMTVTGVGPATSESSP